MSTNILQANTGQLADSSAALYTAPTNTKARIIKAVVCNDTTSVVTYSFWRVPSGDSADATTLLVNARNLPSEESTQVDELIGIVLEAGGAIHGKAGTADQVTYHIDVAEVVE